MDGPFRNQRTTDQISLADRVVLGQSKHPTQVSSSQINGVNIGSKVVVCTGSE